MKDNWKEKLILCEDDTTYDRMWAIVEKEIKKAKIDGIRFATYFWVRECEKYKMSNAKITEIIQMIEKAYCEIKK